MFSGWIGELRIKKKRIKNMTLLLLTIINQQGYGLLSYLKQLETGQKYIKEHYSAIGQKAAQGHDP